MLKILGKLKFLFIAGGAMALLVVLALFLSNRYIVHSSAGHLYDEIQDLPDNHVGLVLGAAKSSRSGSPNWFFRYRVEAAAKLYFEGKVNYLVVSGDNGRQNYDEATDMRDALVELGVPKERIYMDYAGFRTLDSVVRCRKIFGQKTFTIISQEFHNQRAVFLADKFGIEAVAYNCADVSARSSKWVMARESLARLKAVIDVLIRKDPKYLGEQIEIGSPQLETND